MITKIRYGIAFSLGLSLAGLTGGAASANPITVFTSELPPFVTNEGGDDLGSVRDLLVEMAKRANVELEFTFLPWQRSQNEAATTPNSLIIPVGRNPTREPKYSWIVKTFVSNQLFVSNGDPVNSVEAASALESVTVLGGTPRENQLNEAGLSNLNISRNPEMAAKLLTAGRVNAWYTLDQRALYAIKSLGVSRDTVTMGQTLSSTDIWVAANKEFDPAISKALAAALEEMRTDGTYDRIMEKYTG